MSEKRFFVKVYSNNEPFFFDEKQKYVEEKYTCEDVRNLHPMEYWQVVDLLNKLYEENEQLRKELDNFKPVMFQDVRKGTVILYSKKTNDDIQLSKR